MITQSSHKPFIDIGFLMGAALSILISTTSIVAATGGNTDIPSSDQHRTLDDRLVDIGMAAPHFGGVYLDPEDETLVVYVTEGATSLEIANVIDAVHSEFTAAELTTDQIVTVPARYSILELDEWYRRAIRNLIGLEGLVFTDMNEGRNLIEIGVTEEVDSDELETLLGDLDIPNEAIIITPSEPIVLEIRSRRRPVVGGLQVVLPYICTLGFTSWHYGQETYGMVASGHCTEGGEGVVTGSPFFQHGGGSNNQVGIEVIDPPGFTSSEDPNCLPGRVCRYSDAAWAVVDPWEFFPPVDLGYIATPPLQSTSWDGVSKFMISGKGDGLVGTHIQKVGRTTGRTRGVISNTCMMILFSNIDKLCQVKVDGIDDPFSRDGDSGSPVFSISGLEGEVKFRGIHMGRILPNSGVFSPISGIEADLGYMQICPNGVICPPPL